MKSCRHFLVCTTPRSGSSLLCSLLGSSGVAGMRQGPRVGHEYMLELVGRRDQKITFDPLDQDSLRHFIEYAFHRSGTSNGVAGFKLMWEQIRRLALRLGYRANRESFEFNDFATLLPEKTKFIWLTRRDRLRQAVSLARAVQSQCWNSTEQQRFNGSQVFDYIAIMRAKKMLEEHDTMWREFFTRNSKEPLKIVYEDVVHEQRMQVERITDFIGIRLPGTTEFVRVPYRRQTGPVNDQWVERYEQICLRGPGAQGFYTALAFPRWVALSVLSRIRTVRRVRRLSGNKPLP